MRGMQQQLGNWGTITEFASRHRETKKNLCSSNKNKLGNTGSPLRKNRGAFIVFHLIRSYL